METQTHTEERWCGQTQGNFFRQAQERELGKIHPYSPYKGSTGQPLEFELLASKTVRQYVSAV